MTDNITFEQLPQAVNNLTKEVSELKRLLIERQIKPTEDQQDVWLDLNELVAYDPEKRTKATWYSKISKGEVPYHKRGKKIYFLKSEIDDWLKAGKRKTNAEIEAQAEAYALIVCNVVALILQSYEPIFLKFHTFFSWFEVFSVLIFTLKYVGRVWAINLRGAKRGNLIFSTFGIIFLLAILPFYLPMVFPFDLRIVRILRLFRLLRIFKLSRFSKSFKTI